MTSALKTAMGKRPTASFCLARDCASSFQMHYNGCNSTGASFRFAGSSLFLNMTDTTQLAPGIEEPTEARFTIRFLFVAMAVVGVVSALVGPLVRRIEPAAQLRLLAAWGVWLSLSLVMMAFAARRRSRAEKLVGHAIVRVPFYDDRLPGASRARRWFNLVMGGLMTLLMLAAMSFSVVESSRGRGAYSLPYHVFFMGFAGSLWITKIVLPFWWRNNIRFGERGILWDRRVMLWDHLVQYEWKTYAWNLLELRGIDQHNLDMVLRVAVPGELTEPVQRILDEKHKPNPAVEILTPMGQLGSIPLSIAVRDRRFPKYIAMIILWIIGLPFFMYCFRSGFSGYREFDRSIFWGFILSGFLSPRIWRRRSAWSVPTGVPLIRFNARKNWAWGIVFSAAAAAFYFVGSRFSLLAGWIAYASGFGFGVALAKLLVWFWPRRFDFRENGVYSWGRYWPWSDVQVRQWSPDVSGRLVLMLDWERMSATVSPDKRAAVSTVLNEKISRPPPATGDPSV